MKEANSEWELASLLVYETLNAPVKFQICQSVRVHCCPISCWSRISIRMIVILNIVDKFYSTAYHFMFASDIEQFLQPIVRRP
jgi:hypothetical protein